MFVYYCVLFVHSYEISISSNLFILLVDLKQQADELGKSEVIEGYTTEKRRCLIDNGKGAF